jgi:hypothetical protein
MYIFKFVEDTVIHTKRISGTFGPLVGKWLGLESLKSI